MAINLRSSFLLQHEIVLNKVGMELFGGNLSIEIKRFYEKHYFWPRTRFLHDYF